MKQGKPDDAIAAYKKAIELRPSYAQAHCNLGSIHLKRGEFATALEFYRKGHKLGNLQPGWPFPSARWVHLCESLLAQEKRLPDVLASKPTTAAELLSLAQMCQYYKNRNADAALLYEKAFAAAPRLAKGRNLSYRYFAARAAALAAGGKGPGADKLSPAARARLREQARGWLASGLPVLDESLKYHPEEAADIETGLKDWLGTPDLSSVRDDKALAELPEEERQRWKKLWEHVRDIVRRAGKK
jgi:tetratricopeptide (TPR) repeat protein